MKHKHAATLQAILEGQQLQVRHCYKDNCESTERSAWLDTKTNQALLWIGQENTNIEFRVKPDTLKGTVEFPKPFTSIGICQSYWTPDLGRAAEFTFRGELADITTLKAGLAFKSEEDCEAFLAAVKLVLNP